MGMSVDVNAVKPMVTFRDNHYADLTEIVCEVPAPICSSDKHMVAIITHTTGSKWHVRLCREWTSRPHASFRSRMAAEAYVMGRA